MDGAGGEDLWHAWPRNGESKKNETTQCNNCSGSIIPTAEQIRLICVSTWTGRELLQQHCCEEMIHCDVPAQENCMDLSPSLGQRLIS